MFPNPSQCQSVAMPELGPTCKVDSPPILSGMVACHTCGRTLAEWIQAGRKTAIIVPFMLVYRATLVCRCGAQTEWYSRLVSAIRLGIDG
jgi:hypothetical protein